MAHIRPEPFVDQEQLLNFSSRVMIRLCTINDVRAYEILKYVIQSSVRNPGTINSLELNELTGICNDVGLTKEETAKFVEHFRGESTLH